MAPFRIKQIDHVVLRVTDVPESIAFYCGVLGAKEERRLADFGLYQLRVGNSLLDLIDIRSPIGKVGGGRPVGSARNMDHFAIQVEPFDESAIVAHLTAAGVKPGKIENRYGAEGNGPSMYIEDPDGNVVELKGPGTL
jgi:catechol 2,3-dioxygenase-like lactoylglutathione lyase family enzyme